MQGDDRAVLISDWYHCRSSHSQAWTLFKHRVGHILLSLREPIFLILQPPLVTLQPPSYALQLPLVTLRTPYRTLIFFPLPGDPMIRVALLCVGLQSPWKTYLVTYQGVKYVPIKVMTDPARNGIKLAWYSKLLTRAIRMGNMTKKDGLGRGCPWHQWFPPSSWSSSTVHKNTTTTIQRSSRNKESHLEPSRSPISPISPHFPPFSPISPHFPPFFQFPHFSYSRLRHITGQTITNLARHIPALHTQEEQTPSQGFLLGGKTGQCPKMPSTKD